MQKISKIHNETSLLRFSFFFFFWPHHAACGILVPLPGIEPVPPALRAWSLDHLTAREVPAMLFLCPSGSLPWRQLLAVSCILFMCVCVYHIYHT